MSVCSLISAFIACVMFLQGCAQFKPPPMIVKVPSFYEYQTKADGLVLVADPYFEKSKVEHFFNTNIFNDGFLAVHLIVFNESNHTFDIGKADIILRRDDGAEFLPLGPKEVSKKVLKHTSLRMLGWGAAGLIVLTIPFALGAGIDSYRSNKKIRRQISDHIVKVDIIEPKEVVDGFYFFKFAKPGRELRNSRKRSYSFALKNLVNIDTSDSTDYLIELGKLINTDLIEID